MGTAQADQGIPAGAVGKSIAYIEEVGAPWSFLFSRELGAYRWPSLDSTLPTALLVRYLSRAGSYIRGYW